MVSHSYSSLKAMSRMSPPQLGHASGNSSPTCAISFGQAMRDVSWERGFSLVSQQLSATCASTACPTAAASLRFTTFPMVSAVTAFRSR